MKQLFLFRHAESIARHSGQHDKERELSNTGVKEALQMGSYFSRENFSFDSIVTSAAVRTHTTAQLIADVLKFDPDRIVSSEELYEASVRTFLAEINRFSDHHQRVLCVGHNPTISYLAEYLTKAAIGTVTTAGMVMIDFHFDRWAEVGEGNGQLVDYVYPQKVAGSWL